MAGGVLTEKQEAFAVHYVQTANAAEAYRAAYGVDLNARDSWIYVEALQCLEHPKIAPRIKELQERAKERGQYTIDTAAEELEAARELAMSEAQPSAAVSAVNSKVKLFGMDKPQKSEITGADGGPIKTESSGMDNLLAAIATIAERNRDAG